MEDPGYFIPYSSEDGPFECVCDSANGWVYDEVEKDGRCFDCHNIDEHCNRCHFSEDSEDWVCDACDELDWMLTPWNDKCVPKLHGCMVGLYEQPQDLIEIEEKNQWECP